MIIRVKNEWSDGTKGFREAFRLDIGLGYLPNF
jgi:hypothetical protein